MAFITFITTYRPIICGIADYAEFITRESPPGNWEVLSFDLESCGMPLRSDGAVPDDPVWHGIPSRDAFSASSVLAGLSPHENQVLWFQHEFGIWRDNSRFVGMLKGLDRPKVVTLHSLHFQSPETPYGLRRDEYSFLRSLLPDTDAITVFSDGVYNAVTSAFPVHADKVHVLRHGVHLYPEFARMDKVEAKARLHAYLVSESDLDQESKDNLRQQRVFLDPGTVIIGGVGFITPTKGIERLYHACHVLQQMLPEKNVVALYVGRLREPDSQPESKCAVELRSKYGAGSFLLETYLPRDMLALALRALDVYFYWPTDCTQSGIVAHALGAGATIACRDMEGVGETVRMAGGLTSTDFGQLIDGIKELIVNPMLRDELSERAVGYAELFSWRNQAARHFEIAERLSRSRIQLLLPAGPLAVGTGVGREQSLAL